MHCFICCLIWPNERIKNLNVKCKVIKLLEDNKEPLNDLEYSDDFFDTIPKAQPMEETIDKLDFVKVKNFHSTKNSIKIMRRQATECEETFA